MYKPYVIRPTVGHNLLLSLYETVVIACLLFLVPIVELSIWSVESFRQYNPLMVPLIEESFKTLAIILGGAIALGFTILFGIFEATNYIFEALDKGPVHYSYIIFRILCIFLHLGLLYVQWYGFKSYQQGKGAIHWLLGFLTAYSIHYIWNVGAGKVFLNLTLDVCIFFETLFKMLFSLFG